jgi:hypothetical protein
VLDWDRLQVPRTARSSNDFLFHILTAAKGSPIVHLRCVQSKSAIEISYFCIQLHRVLLQFGAREERVLVIRRSGVGKSITDGKPEHT